jgi:hypothetical protein
MFNVCLVFLHLCLLCVSMPRRFASARLLLAAMLGIVLCFALHVLRAIDDACPGFSLPRPLCCPASWSPRRAGFAQIRLIFSTQVDGVDGMGNALGGARKKCTSRGKRAGKHGRDSAFKRKPSGQWSWDSSSAARGLL